MEKMNQLIPRNDIVVSHGDIWSDNILLCFDNWEVCLIDYEYGSWNPRMYDLATYLCEQCCDSSSPSDIGIVYYFQNLPTEEEIVSITHMYCSLANGELGLDDNELKLRVTEVKQCMIIELFIVCLWCIMMLKEEDDTNPDVF